MKTPKPKGLAKLVTERVEEDVTFMGLHPFDFDPQVHNGDKRMGLYGPGVKCEVDRLLSVNETYAALWTPASHQLDTVDGWYDALKIAKDSKLRQHSSFRTILSSFAGPNYSLKEKEEMRDGFIWAMAADPNLSAQRVDGAPAFEPLDEFKTSYPHDLRTHHAHRK